MCGATPFDFEIIARSGHRRSLENVQSRERRGHSSRGWPSSNPRRASYFSLDRYFAIAAASASLSVWAIGAISAELAPLRSPLLNALIWLMI